VGARTAMRAIGAGRAAIGIALLAAPAAVGRGWLGPTADEPAGQVALRAIGARDALLGLMAVHVAGSAPGVAARWSSAIAVCDLVDGGATLVARDRLPDRAVAVVALALGAAGAGVAIAAALRADA
jgi:hypothetical protein